MGDFNVDEHIRRIRENPFRVVVDRATGTHVAVPVVRGETPDQPPERHDEPVLEQPEEVETGAIEPLLPQDWAEIYADVLRLEELYHLSDPIYGFRFGPPCSGCAAAGEQFLQGVYVERPKKRLCGLCGAALGKGYSPVVKGRLSQLVWPGVDVARLALPDAAPSSTEAAEDRWHALRQWRLTKARKQGVPAFVIFHDTTLREIADQAPTTTQALLAIHGMGPAKLEKYGDELIALTSETIVKQ